MKTFNLGKNILLYSSFLMFFSFATTAKTYTGYQADSILRGATAVITHDDYGTVQSIRFDNEPITNVKDRTIWLQNLLSKFSENIAVNALKQETDDIGYTHYFYRQTIDDITVEHSTIKIHTKNGAIHGVTAEYFPVADMQAGSENFSEEAAISFAKNYLLGKGSISSSHKIENKGTFYIKRPNQPMALCYKMEAHGTSPTAVRAFLYLSKIDGSLVFEENRIIHTNVVGTAHTKYNGTVAITTDSISPSSFILRETGTRSIATKNMGMGTSYFSATNITDNNNIWTVDSAAHDAHYGAEKTHEYFLNVHGRNSYDNAGAPINSFVHYDFNYVNAFWDGYQMTYGDGDGVNYGPLTTMDVVGHEITHAVTENSANLVYTNESGALNESFSDIFGVAIEFFANPAAGNFTMGEQFVLNNGLPFRNFANPNQLQDPDTYQGTYWDFVNQEVHRNGVPHTYWFYLLCQGGSGVNDNAQSYSVSSITMAHAAKIAYRALTVYLTPNSNYAASRVATIQAAKDLYGSCSAQEIQVTNAWHAVGVGAIYQPVAVLANFTSADTTNCNLPAVVNFSNTSTGGNNYLWNFGDGNTATTFAPSHTYTTSGTFTVTLTVMATGPCGTGANTKIRTNYIVVNGGIGPVSASCYPQATNPNYYDGISNVTLGNINHNSGYATEGYLDRTCTDSTTLVIGNFYPISVTTFDYNEKVRVWLDANNDGQFSSTELVADFPSGSYIKTGNIFIPATAVTNTPLRMRVMSDYFTLTTACASPGYGQAEDYTVFLDTVSTPPVANFTTTNYVVTPGTTVNFTDISTNAPTAWSWTMQGGTPATSTVQNASATFNTLGAYSVTLIATNAFGSDTITKNITVVNAFAMCVDQTSTADSGIVTDSGGPNGSYANNENCSFLINPGTCTDSIVLNITKFKMWSSSDYMRVYNGPTTSSQLLYSNSYPVLPVKIVGTSNQMLVTFISNSSGVDSGFVANWIAHKQQVPAPTASFTASQTNIAFLDTVIFTDGSSNTTTAWSWNFGDGGISTQQNPTHIYAQSGTFTVTLIAESCNAFDTTTQTITVQPAPTVSYNPAFFNVSLGCNDTADVNLLISNTNGGALNWNVGSAGISEILVWTYGTDYNLTVVNSLNAINQYAPGNNITQTSTTVPSTMQSLLSNKDVLLLPTNFSGNNTILSQMTPVLQNFVNNGGTLITCADFNLQAPTKIGLFTGAYTNYLNSGTVQVINTSTPLTDSLPANLTVTSYAARYNLTNPNKQKIIESGTSDIVTYLPYGLGKAIFIGFDYRTINPDFNRVLGNAVRWSQGGLSSANLQVLPTNGSVTMGNTDTVLIRVNSNGLSGGLDTAWVIVNTNDPNSPVDSIPIYMNISTMPCVNFGNTAPGNCTGTLAFADSTLNNPTSWAWNFGDGNTSTLQNPTHLFAVAGTYTVTLVATNATGTDSFSKNIIVNGVHGPQPIACYPIASNPNANDGIALVSLGNINKGSGTATEGYLDNTCTDSTSLQLGMPHTITVNVYDPNERVKVWLDMNNDGQLSATEELAYITTYGNVKQATFTLPGTVVTNTPLRLRIVCDSYNLTTSCATITYGQAEDYTVKVKPITTPPVANFTTTTWVVGTGSPVALQDLSSNFPSSWSWTLNGGTPSTSTIQNPSTTFNTVGTYALKLVATNAFGSDSITKNITVLAGDTMCVQASSTTDTGVLFDSGGPTGSYSNNQNCSFLINPGTCTDSIVLLISKYKMYSSSDYLRVYNGATTSSQLLFNSSNPLLPTKIVGTNNQMLVTFYSNTSGVDSGFVANWTAHKQVLPAPTAAFTFAATNPALLDTVVFTDGSSNNTTVWNWNFGDGGTSTVQNPNHIYTQAGTYTITMIAESCNAFDTITQNITVQASPTVAYNPGFFNVTLGCNDTVDVNLLISNTNGGQLNWNMNGNNSVTGNEMLVWDRLSSGYPSMYNNTLLALNQHFTNYTMTTTSTIIPSVMQNLLVGKKVLLIPSIYTATPVSTFAPVVQNFVQNGGTVIVNGTDYVNVLSDLGLFNANYLGFNSATNTIVNTTTPLSDSLTTNFSTVANTLYFNITDPNKVTIATYANNDVVTYKPIGAGKAISIGYNYVSINNNIGQVLGNAVRWGMQGNNVGSANLQLSPTSGSVAMGNTDTVLIRVNSTGLAGGLDTAWVVVNTNDTNSLVDSIPIYMNISTMPCVKFGNSTATACSGVINFLDSTLNTPTSWAWNFGDGNNSTLQNPTHLYAAAGTYQVKLLATNATGTDSFSKSITILGTFGPAAASCSPVATNPNLYKGISNVTLGTINNTSSNATEGYLDKTCTDSTRLIVGNNYPISITVLDNTEYVRVWLDMNNDGQLSTTEVIADFNIYSYLKTGFINIPGTAVKGVPLRMRVASEDYTLLATSCTNPLYGQMEDYTVILDTTTVAPIANFGMSNWVVTPNTLVTFYDSSTNAPSQWSWTIVGASPTTSIVQNPSATFTTPGTYPVKLVASNNIGSDSITKFVTVVNAFTMCTNTASTVDTGKLFDSGGPNGNYQNNENCSFLINPGTCTDSIVLQRVLFQTESGYDYLTVYNGPTTGSTILWTGSGSFMPPTITGTASQMLIRFSSDGSAVLPGFELNWIAHKAAAPVANFTYAPSSPQSGNPVMFFNTSSANTTAWNWNFGNGNTSTLPNPTNIYTTPGTYTITLIVTSCGKTDTTTQTIVVQGTLPPNVTFTSQNADCKGLVNFAITGSTIYTNYNWDFGDGNTANSTTLTQSHTYTTGGTYAVRLVSYSPQGNDTTITNVIVFAWTPTITRSGSPNIGSPINFGVTSATNIIAYNWNFGDGNTSTAANPSNTYTAAGVYYVTAIVQDANCQLTIYDTINIIASVVNNLALNNNISVYPNPFTNQVSLDFTDLGMADNLEITIYNTLSQVVHNLKTSNIDLSKRQRLIDASSFSNGTYFIKINVDDNQYNVKLLKVDK